MKITKEELANIIKEEVEKALGEKQSDTLQAVENAFLGNNVLRLYTEVGRFIQNTFKGGQNRINVKTARPIVDANAVKFDFLLNAEKRGVLQMQIDRIKKAFFDSRVMDYYTKMASEANKSLTNVKSLSQQGAGKIKTTRPDFQFEDGGRSLKVTFKFDFDDMSDAGLNVANPSMEVK